MPTAPDIIVPADPFIELSANAWTGLRHAVLECSWIADGGDPTASQADRDLAALRRLEYERDKIRISERTIAFYAKTLSVTPPSAKDVAEAVALAEQLAKMRDINVKLTAVISAATKLIELYNRTDA